MNFTYATEADILKMVDEASKEQAEDLTKYFLDYSEEISKPVAIISDPVDMDKIIVSEGNLLTIAGEAKSYKSFCASRLVIDFFEQHPNEHCILIDTEQAEWNVANVARRICRGLGWNYKEAMTKGQLKIANLRPYGCEKRKAITEAIIKAERPMFCVVDGVRDLVKDINDSIECSALVDMLMALTADYKCAIGCILHTNKDGETLRGHLGSELQNKSEIVLFCKRRESGKGVRVSCKMSRNIEIEDFELEIDGRFVPVRTASAPAEQIKVGTKKETEALNALRIRKNVSRTEWANDIRTACGCASDTAYKYLLHFIELGYLLKDDQDGNFLTHYKWEGNKPQPQKEEATQLTIDNPEDPF